MLVCNVSLRPARAGIAGAVAEFVEATDATATGNVVFATLVDDPASIGDSVDAYIGEIMAEAASAADDVAVAGSVYAAAVDETATAADVVIIAASIYSVSLDETAAAADDSDATVTTVLITRSGMIAGVYVNSDGTSREANVNGIMVNL